MSTYVREKVLRVPMERLNTDSVNNAMAYKLFEYGTVHKFQIAPTEEEYVDYVLEYEWDADGEYGKTRALTDNEKRKYLSVFQKIDPSINMDWVRLVEFCWYNCSEAPSYYDHMNDSFYDEV